MHSLDVFPPISDIYLQSQSPSQIAWNGHQVIAVFVQPVLFSSLDFAQRKRALKRGENRPAAGEATLEGRNETLIVVLPSFTPGVMQG